MNMSEVFETRRGKKCTVIDSFKHLEKPMKNAKHSIVQIGNIKLQQKYQLVKIIYLI